MKMENKKIIIPISVVVILLIVLVVGASFAYFAVTGRNSTTNTGFNANVGEPGSVAIKSTSNGLLLDLSPLQMIQLGETKSYYASSSGVTNAETFEELAVIEAAGDGIFNCTYTMEIVASSKTTESNMYTAFQNMKTKSAGQIVFTINTQQGNEVYDFNQPGLFTASNLYKQTFEGTATGIEEGKPQSIKAQLKIVNLTDVIQDDLKNTDINLALTVKSINCKLVG